MICSQKMRASITTNKNSVPHDMPIIASPRLLVVCDFFIFFKAMTPTIKAVGAVITVRIINIGTMNVETTTGKSMFINPINNNNCTARLIKPRNIETSDSLWTLVDTVSSIFHIRKMRILKQPSFLHDVFLILTIRIIVNI